MLIISIYIYIYVCIYIYIYIYILVSIFICAWPASGSPNILVYIYIYIYIIFVGKLYLRFRHRPLWHQLSMELFEFECDSLGSICWFDWLGRNIMYTSSGTMKPQPTTTYIVYNIIMYLYTQLYVHSRYDYRFIVYRLYIHDISLMFNLW